MRATAPATSSAAIGWMSTDGRPTVFPSVDMIGDTLRIEELRARTMEYGMEESQSKSFLSDFARKVAAFEHALRPYDRQGNVMSHTAASIGHRLRSEVSKKFSTDESSRRERSIHRRSQSAFHGFANPSPVTELTPELGDAATAHAHARQFGNQL